MTFVFRRVDAVVGIEQLHRQHRRILAPHGNGPWIRLRFRLRILIRIVDHHPFERAVVVEGDERRPVFRTGPARHQKGRPVIGGFRQTTIPDPIVGGDRFPDAPQRHGRRHAKRAGKAVVAPRGIHHTAAPLGRRVQRPLEGRSVVRLAIGNRAKLEHIENVGCPDHRHRASQKQRHPNAQQRSRTGSHECAA